MFKTNYHTHSDYCDGHGKPEEFVKAAIDKGFKILGFSGHAPLPFSNEWTMTEDNLPSYLEEVEKLKQEYSGKIEIKKGLEIDYIKDVIAPGDSVYDQMELDYRIGSVHILKSSDSDGMHGIDYNVEEIKKLLEYTFHGKGELLVREYYKALRELSDKKGFDILGHFDVIKKNNFKYRFFDEKEEWYREEIEKTLDVISGNGQIIEVNTGNIYDNPEAVYPSPWILKEAFKRDIPITLDADAHWPERLDNWYEEAVEMIKDCGYGEIKIFTEKNWINHSLY